MLSCWGLWDEVMRAAQLERLRDAQFERLRDAQLDHLVARLEEQERALGRPARSSCALPPTDTSRRPDSGAPSRPSTSAA
jgi:hypothetical protein